MKLKERMPLLSRHEGVWEGYYRYYSPEGDKIDEHRSRLLCRFPSDDVYHQTNFYFWADGRKEVRDFPTKIEGNKIIFYTEVQGWAAEVPLDDFNRTVMLYWVRTNEDDLHLYEMIQLSDCGKYRSRVWQWFKAGKLLQRTLIDEQFITKDWASYENTQSAYDDVAQF
ncbi:DUF3598 domain-containing protein [Alkalimonas sp. MEB108]|uniref:DUF3598 domain-containing protein n=1 Tax=Alkalimonas cellulosilytica TaxID=3058395 RepID=A0ABU7J8R7_9GAMM|nr:DUF3598 family protein [Alkalimonas sp. MEB108]MEE2002933.1 DUF3598 domain-containing protein [Alkalimonas sp. MEB108]